MSKREKVATTFNCRDISSTDEEVVTTFSCRDISNTDEEVATSLIGRDISNKERRSRHHSEVATAAASKRGHDISPLSQHHIQGKQVAT